MPGDAQPLLEFIDAMKSQGASDEFVVALLRQNGWSEKRIYQAFGAWYEARIGRPAPGGGGRIEAARDAFLYLLAFMTLGVWAVQLGALLFSVIDRAFPNRALDYARSEWMVREMSNELASIMVGFPLFLLITWVIERGTRMQVERLESPVRKWLTYIALVLAAGTVIGDLVTFLAFFLRGDVDTRFALKVLTVFAIAGGVFAYYLDSLRRELVSSARNRAFGIAAFAAVVFGVVAGFIQIGSPASQRGAVEDARRRFDLSCIAHAIHEKWSGRESGEFALPATLREAPPSESGRITDPATGQAYEYTPLQGTAYRLCAVFSRPSPADAGVAWRHPAGRACFTLDASNHVAIESRPW